MTPKPIREPTPREKFNRMTELTRRLLAVPKSEIHKKAKLKRAPRRKS